MVVQVTLDRLPEKVIKLGEIDMSIIFLFIDGVGLAPPGKNNPFSVVATPCLSSLLDGKTLTLDAADRTYDRSSLLSLDATLGVKGLPQSATGQATLFTGVNAARLLGFHLRGFPVNSGVRRSFREECLKYLDKGLHALPTHNRIFRVS